jgi:hypothetical protein
MVMRDRDGSRRVAADERTDNGLRQLLAVEERLEALVRTAAEDAAQRVAAAAAAQDAQLAEARRQAQLADEQQAGADRLAHDAELKAIAADGDAVVARLAGTPEARVDALARWVLQQAIDGSGGAP